MDYSTSEAGMIYSDVHEPEEFIKYVSPAVECTREVLNERQYADYCWRDVDSRLTQVERKTWGEILADVGAVEDQLRRHLRNQPEARLLFVLEGMVDVDSGGTYVLKQTTGQKRMWVRSWKSGTRISRIYSWLYAASEYVEVFQTPNYELTCQFLVQCFKQDQKTDEEKKAFNRYFKKTVFHPNPQVMALMGLSPGLGEVRAEALIDEFTTVWQVLNASPEELQRVKGIGPQLATTMLQRIGRVDV